MPDSFYLGPAAPSSWSHWILIGALIALPACSAQSPPAPTDQAEAQQPVVVDVAVATPSDQADRTYTGTTAPITQVTLRSQAEGQLLSLAVDVGDPVQSGQLLATLDSDLLQTALQEAQAELAARRFEVAQAEAQLADTRTQIEQAKVQMQQAQSDTDRLLALASKGAISDQAAEQAQTTLRTAQQAYQSTQEQLRTRQQAVAAAQQRVTVQQAVVDQAQKRLTYARLDSPLNGVVLERLAEPGDLIQPGQSLLTLGDLRQIQVTVEVADINLQQFRLGQSVTLQIDALPGEQLTGTVSKIAPLANSTSRLVPIEITVANPGGRIGSGLLARVALSPSSPGVSVPESALAVADQGQEDQGKSDSAKATPTTDHQTNQAPRLYVLTTVGDQTQVEVRSVQVGTTTNGQVEIRSGLTSGEKYVVRSASPLTPGQVVQPSLSSDSQ